MKVTGARVAISVALVWIASIAFYAAGFVVIPAVVLTVATVVWAPIGFRTADRIVVLAIASTAYVALISWVSPYVPVLVHPAVVVGLLGTPLALAWSLRRTATTRLRTSDYVALGTGLVAGVLWSLPFRPWTPARIVDVLYTAASPDVAAHVAMFRDVWTNHGYYLVQEASIGGAVYYPQGIHAVFAAVGSIVTSSSIASDVPTSLTIYAAMSCAIVGMLAFTSAWGVERLLRRMRGPGPVLRSTAQVLPAVIVVLGPGAWLLMNAPGLVGAVTLAIAAMCFAATARRSVPGSGLCVALASAASLAMYPLMVIVLLPTWVLYVQQTRTFWSTRRMTYDIGLVITVVICAPSLVRSVLTRSADVFGNYVGVPPLVFVLFALAVAGVLILGYTRLPRAVVKAGWVSAFATIAISVLATAQWLRTGDVAYYPIKALYPCMFVAVLITCAAAVPIVTRWRPKRPYLRSSRNREISIATAVALAVFSLVPTFAPSHGRVIFPSLTSQLTPGVRWAVGAIVIPGYGDWIVPRAPAADSQTVAVILPCDFNSIDRWLALAGGDPYKNTSALSLVGCKNGQPDPVVLSEFIDEVRAHPDLHVIAYVSDPAIATQLRANQPPNLEVIEDTEIPK